MYVLQGILDELQKVDRLTNFVFLKDRILIPALAFAKERRLITSTEEQVLHIAAQKGVAKAADLSAAMRGSSPSQQTYQIRKLVEKRMLLPIKEGARQYTIGFSNNYLLRGVIGALSNEGFIPSFLNRLTP